MTQAGTPVVAPADRSVAALGAASRDVGRLRLAASGGAVVQQAVVAPGLREVAASARRGPARGNDAAPTYFARSSSPGAVGPLGLRRSVRTVVDPVEEGRSDPDQGAGPARLGTPARRDLGGRSPVARRSASGPAPGVRRVLAGGRLGAELVGLAQQQPGRPEGPPVPGRPAAKGIFRQLALTVAPPRGTPQAPEGLAPPVPDVLGAVDVVRRRDLPGSGAPPSAGMPPGAVAAFQAAAAGHAQYDEQEGPSVNDDPVVITRRGGGDAPAPTVLGRRQLEEIVDSVVEQLERRVLDELERRGRRHVPGVF